MVTVIYATQVSVASAHGLFDRTSLPIPQWLFGWAAAAVLVVSFLALGLLWSKPKLASMRWRPLPNVLNRVLINTPMRVVCGTVASLLLVLVIWSGFAGSQSPEHNFAPTFVYVIFWIGLVLASIVFGDIFRAFNPWAAIAHTVSRIASGIAGESLRAPFSYPKRLGYWPAAFGLIGFAALELVAYGGIRPQSVALATVVYSFITFAGMALFGIKPWLDRGEAFSVYFNLFSRLSPFELRGRRLGLRFPLTGLSSIPTLPGITVLLAAMIGAVTFDGASEGALGLMAVPKLQKLVESLGLNATEATQISLGLTLLAVIALVLAFFRLGIAGARRMGSPVSAGRLAREFAPTLVPIALAYVGAHYLTLFIYQGQAITQLASDPLGTGLDLFGTAKNTINHGILGATGAWYMEVGLVVSGHVAALTLAHDRALELYSQTRQALRSQCWMLGVMVGFTILALWLLSQANI